MKLIALLSWYDEQDDFLYKGLKSLAKAEVDHVVALDGAYGLFADGLPHSPASNVEAIETACAEIGAGLTLHQPETVWAGNEIEKRTFLFRLAEEVSEPGVDWLLVWDADQVMGPCPRLKQRLAETELDAADFRVLEPPLNGQGETWPGTGIVKPTQLDVRLAYRATPGIYCYDNHYTYRTPDGRYLWGNGSTDPLVPGLGLYDVIVLHKTNQRTVSRKGRAVRYYNDRKKTKAEDRICHFCREPHALEEDIVHDWQWVKKDGRWHISGGLVSTCEPCRLKHGTPRHKPLILTCPECKGKASRRNPCAFCQSKGYKVEDPKRIEQNLRTVVAIPN